jgi:hypothetical protein
VVQVLRYGGWFKEWIVLDQKSPNGVYHSLVLNPVFTSVAVNRLSTYNRIAYGYFTLGAANQQVHNGGGFRSFGDRCPLL